MITWNRGFAQKTDSYFTFYGTNQSFYSGICVAEKLLLFLAKWNKGSRVLFEYLMVPGSGSHLNNLGSLVSCPILWVLGSGSYLGAPDPGRKSQVPLFWYALIKFSHSVEGPGVGAVLGKCCKLGPSQRLDISFLALEKG